jgi:hypothetical protein
MIILVTPQDGLLNMSQLEMKSLDTYIGKQMLIIAVHCIHMNLLLALGLSWFILGNSSFLYYAFKVYAQLNKTCRFPCGRWLAKSNDDGSTERLLVAELQQRQTNNNEGWRSLHLMIITTDFQNGQLSMLENVFLIMKLYCFPHLSRS